MGPLAYAIIFFLLFFIAMTLEIMLPTAGTLCVLALVSAAISLYFAWTAGVWYLVGTMFSFVLAIPALIVIFQNFWKYSPMGRVVEELAPKEAADPQEYAKEMIGQRGKVSTELRPSGVIQIGARRISVTSKAGTIEKDEVVQIVEVKMNRFFVLPVDWVETEFVQPSAPAKDADPKVEDVVKEDLSQTLEDKKEEAKQEKKSDSIQQPDKTKDQDSKPADLGSGTGKFEDFNWE